MNLMDPVQMQGWKRGRSGEPSQRQTRQMSGNRIHPINCKLTSSGGNARQFERVGDEVHRHEIDTLHGAKILTEGLTKSTQIKTLI